MLYIYIYVYFNKHTVLYTNCQIKLLYFVLYTNCQIKVVGKYFSKNFNLLIDDFGQFWILTSIEIVYYFLNLTSRNNL